jgi:REP element-mobilizing transposase RayT
MARPLRIEYPGAYYHITSRSNDRKAIFETKKDREGFISYLKSAHLRYGAKVHVYCLMSNHYHLLLETPKGNLSKIMHHVNGAYTTYFNVKHKRAGHLFQGRYKAILVDADAYAAELSRYVHLNPVRAGIVSRPEKYQWSSYNCFIDKKKKADWIEMDLILGYFDKGHLSMQKSYANFVLAKLNDKNNNPLEDTYASTILGDDSFIEKTKEKYLKDKEIDRNLPALRELKKTERIDVVFKEVISFIGDDHKTAKKAALFICHRFGGNSLKEIGDYFKIRESSVSSASYRFNQALKRKKGLRLKVEQIQRQLKLHNA